jgi:hypothetical protein
MSARGDKLSKPAAALAKAPSLHRLRPKARRPFLKVLLGFTAALAFTLRSVSGACELVGLAFATLQYLNLCRSPIYDHCSIFLVAGAFGPWTALISCYTSVQYALVYQRPCSFSGVWCFAAAAFVAAATNWLTG